MNHRFYPTICLGLFLLLTQHTLAGSQRYWLADCEQWSTKQGFTLHLENSSKGDEPQTLDQLALVGGIGTGKNFRYVTTRPAWELNRVYTATFQITADSATLLLDGKLIKQMQYTMSPSERSHVVAASHPSWANRGENADYQIIQHQLAIEADGQTPLQTMLLMPEQLSAGNLWRFEPTGDGNTKLAFKTQPGQAFILTASFSIIPRVPVDKLPAMIDRYGQAIEATFPGKVRNDADLKARWEDEKQRLEHMPPSSDYDRYGGYLKANWKEQATGFYRTVKHDGKYWFITPDGNPCFYLGMCTVPSLNWPATGVAGRENIFAELPPQTPPYSDAWASQQSGGEKVYGLSFHAVNMIRKYGDDWQAIAKDMAVQRLAALGFHGIGKWGGSFGDGAQGGGIDALPVTPVLYWRGVPGLAGKPDFFDAAIAQQCKEALAKQITPHLNNPLIVGWSIGNEKAGIVWPEEINTILQKDAKTAAKRALIDYALRELYTNNPEQLAMVWKSQATTMEQLYNDTKLTLPKEDFEKVRCFYADAYHAFAYKTIKAVDPNHLYLSYWIVPGWWVNENDWFIAAKHCDVLGYDRYALTYADLRMTDLLKQADKPTLVGEFNFPADYQGKRGYGSFKVSTGNETQMGQVYENWVRDATASPWCVGLLYFHYRDQPLTGRSLGKVNNVVGGEHYAFGIVDITDTPKWELVTQMRNANLNAAKWRLNQ